MNFRKAIYGLLPRWLTTDNSDGEKIAYVLSVLKDEWLERLRLGLFARYPDYAPDDALALIGRARRISRGIEESRENYTRRLKLWLDAHLGRGGPYKFLQQVGIHWDGFFFANDPLIIVLISRSGLAFTYDSVDGNITREIIPWDVDSQPERWARWWLIFANWPDGSINNDGTWGDAGTWGDGGTWSTNLAPITIERLRLVPKDWDAAHPYGGRIGLLGPGAELWGYPVGTWGDPGVWGGGNYAEIAVG